MNSNRSYNSGQNWWFLVPCDLEIWRMTLKNNRAPALCQIKICASCHRQMWIQTLVLWSGTAQLGFFLCDLTFDLWPWPFAWASPLPMVITRLGRKRFLLHQLTSVTKRLCCNISHWKLLFKTCNSSFLDFLGIKKWLLISTLKCMSFIAGRLHLRENFKYFWCVV